MSLLLHSLVLYLLSFTDYHLLMFPIPVSFIQHTFHHYSKTSNGQHAPVFLLPSIAFLLTLSSFEELHSNPKQPKYTQKIRVIPGRWTMEMKSAVRNCEKYNDKNSVEYGPSSHLSLVCSPWLKPYGLWRSGCMHPHMLSWKSIAQHMLIQCV